MPDEQRRGHPPRSRPLRAKRLARPDPERAPDAAASLEAPAAPATHAPAPGDDAPAVVESPVLVGYLTPPWVTRPFLDKRARRAATPEAPPLAESPPAAVDDEPPPAPAEEPEAVTPMPWLPPPPTSGPPGRDEPPRAMEVRGAPLVTRVGCALLECVLFIAGLGVGWVIWWVALWHCGGSPARSLLHLDLVRGDAATSPGWRRTAARELAAKLLVPLAPISALVWLRGRRGLWDRMTATTIVGPR